MMGLIPEWGLQSQPTFNFWLSVGQLGLAALLGGIIGAERELSGHPAGLRTNILVAVGSCLFTILSINAFPLSGAAQDTARIAAQIVTGVGFLGAGAVIQTKKAVQGLTTAATIWLVAAIGMSSGTQLYALGIVTTIFTAGILFFLGPLSTWLAVKGEIRHRRHEEALREAGQEHENNHDV